MMTDEELETLSGRQIVVNWTEYEYYRQHSYSIGIDFIRGIEQTGEGFTCNRCGSNYVYFLPGKIPYCRECIGLGRITGDYYLMRVEETGFSSLHGEILEWDGELTAGQEQIALTLVDSFLAGKNHLVHAVTGAGKTEMLFPVLTRALKLGKRVCIATPRIDVVNELYPRIRKVLPSIVIGKYHGREYLTPVHEQLTICTTHQLLKFYHAFDLIIIDEVDAFPFNDSAVLYFGAQNAIKVNGSTFFLTATPSTIQLQDVKNNKLNYSLLNRRFHGFDLPVPELHLILRPTIKKNGQLNFLVNNKLRYLVALHKPIMVFVPRIEQLPILAEVLRKNFPQIRIETVHAKDKDRILKIKSFRNGEIDLLLTTTILERGVTIAKTQVVVLDADDRIYNVAALIQIAGRAGRKKDEPTGEVAFFYHEFTVEIKQAIKQIREMNRK